VSNFLDLALELSAAAGVIMLEHFDIGVPADWKEDDTPVTVADEAINQMVVDRIAAEYPNHGVIGEELSSVKPESRFQWVCDPIDGTLPYMLGIPTNLFSLALCEDGQPIVAVIEDPYLARTYSATQGGGAFVNERRLAVSARTELRGTLMNVSGRSRGDAAWGAAIYYDLERAGAEQLHHNSMVYEEILVASGMFDGAIFTKSTPWDAAAGALLVSEAGGKATDLHGRQQRYDRAIKGAIFSNGLIHDELQALVAPHIFD
jgi:fructose-1,6-bisphosphatase/inositol monophosphatase family enzyme